MANLSTATSYQINNASLFINTADPIGTRGSASFNANREVRNIATEEGYASPIQGYDRVISWNATITAEVTQLNSGSWSLFEKGGTVVAGDLIPANANLFYTAGQYFSGIALVGTLGDGTRIGVKFPLGLLNTYEWSSDSQNEGAVSCTFTAVLSTTAASVSKDACPFTIDLSY